MMICFHPDYFENNSLSQLKISHVIHEPIAKTDTDVEHSDSTLNFGSIISVKERGEMANEVEDLLAQSWINKINV